MLAGVGTFLSFFHQGSLGGLYGVLRGRPFAFREGFAIWPSTFFLFILSAAAVGPELHPAHHLAGGEDHRRSAW